jgi:hypothetical protein
VLGPLALAHGACCCCLGALLVLLPPGACRPRACEAWGCCCCELSYTAQLYTRGSRSAAALSAGALRGWRCAAAPQSAAAAAAAEGRRRFGALRCQLLCGCLLQAAAVRWHAARRNASAGAARTQGGADARR